MSKVLIPAGAMLVFSMVTGAGVCMAANPGGHPGAIPAPKGPIQAEGHMPSAAPAADEPSAAGPGRPADLDRPDLRGLFAEPVKIVDQDGNEIMTRKAVGHPVVMDYDGDGRNDILLGCHQNMDTAAAQILVLLNVGTKAEPKFQWPTGRLIKLEGSGQMFSASCGCKSGGTFEVFPVDWNGDGRLDLVVNTYWGNEGVRLLTNTCKSGEDPRFAKGAMLHRISGHGKRSGGGDWNNDGITDLAFPINGYGWQLYPGVRGAGGAVTFADKPAFTSKDFKMVGQDRWFDYSPYAWNFSGKRPAGSKAVEIIAVQEEPANKGKPYAQHVSHIEHYVLDHQARTVTRQGRLWTVPAALARMSIGDLNSDGCMDLLTTGGVFTRGEGTNIWVLYGKVRNVPAADRAHGTPGPNATQRDRGTEKKNYSN